MTSSIVMLLFSILCCTGSLINYEVEGRVRRSSGVDSQVDFFLRQGLTNLKSFMKNGAPEFGVPPMDPMRTRDVNINTDKGSTKIRGNFTKLLVYGLSNFEIRYLHANLNQLKMDLTLKFPNVTVNGMYDMHGKAAYVIPVYGNGRFEAEGTDVIVTGVSVLKIQPNGTLMMQNLFMGMEVDKVHVHFHGLYGGGAMSGAANTVVNVFGKKIFENVKPKLIEKLTTSIQNNLNKKLENFNVGKLVGKK